jgi:hypothetical protein
MRGDASPKGSFVGMGTTVEDVGVDDEDDDSSESESFVSNFLELFEPFRLLRKLLRALLVVCVPGVAYKVT